MFALVRHAVILAVCAFTVSARAEEPDGPAGREAIRKEARATFLAGDYARLERTADDLRKTRARLPEGLWKLPFFHAGLDPTYGGKAKPNWREWFAQLDAWQQAFPDSPTQPVARAEALVAYGWEARGTGYADTVTPEGWKLLAERLGQARKALEDAAGLPERDPQWYAVMQRVALGEGWNHDRYQALFDQAVAIEPTYYDYYFARTLAELPRWGGGPDAWLRFAEDAAREDDPDEGLSVYTRIVWSHQGTVGGGMRNPRFDWPKFRQGFLDIEKHHPDSNWNRNNFCRFACQAGDRATARGLFAGLGDAADLTVWESRRAFEDWRRWAQSEQGPAQPRASLEISRDEAVPAAALAFSPDGKTLLAGYHDGRARLWDLASRTVVWSDNLNREEVAAVAWSPDGKVFAAATGDQYRRKPGVVKLWSTATQATAATIPQAGSVFGLAFTPDAKTLAIVGGNYPDGNEAAHGEAALYDVVAGKLDPLPWDDGGYALDAVAISPDGRFLVTPKGNAMNCWSLEKREFVADHHTHSVHGNPVRAVAISPDGRTLVTGVAPGWTNRRDPGELRRWDMTAPGWPEIRTPAWDAPPSGVLALAFSPDGRWLVTGGYDGAVRLWETATGKVAATLLGHQQIVLSLAFAPDGKTLASGGSDGTIQWWDVPAAAPPP